MPDMRIMVAGADSTSYTLLKYLKQKAGVSNLFSLPLCDNLSEFSVPVDIKENDINSVLYFAKSNNINLTIVTSDILIVNGIANAFEDNGLTIFAPKRESAVVTYFRGAAKKTMYKLKIPTERFAIFDKSPNVGNYLRQMKFPIYVSPDFKILTTEKTEYKSFSGANEAIDNLFFCGEERVVIEENNPDLKEFNLYFLSDGYSSYLFGTTEYDELEIATSPSVTLSNELINEIHHNVVNRLLKDISDFSSPYSGIIGVKVKSNGNIFKVIDFMSTFDKYDYETILPTIDSNLLDLYYSASVGSLSDEFEKISFNSTYASSILTEIQKTQMNNEEFSYTPVNEKYGIVTVCASTVNKAKQKLADIINENQKEMILK